MIRRLNLMKNFKISKLIFGNDHTETRLIYFDLGFIHFSQKKFEKAVEIFEFALKIRI